MTKQQAIKQAKKDARANRRRVFVYRNQRGDHSTMFFAYFFTTGRFIAAVFPNGRVEVL